MANITSISSEWETSRAQSSSRKRDGRFGVWLKDVPYESKELPLYRIVLGTASQGTVEIPVIRIELQQEEIGSIQLYQDDALVSVSTQLVAHSNGLIYPNHSLIIIKEDVVVSAGAAIPAHVVYNDVLDGAITHTYALLPLRGHMQGLPTASPNNEQEGMNRNGSQFSSYDFNGIKVATQLSGEFLWNDPAASKLHSLLAAGGTIKLHFEFRGFPLEQAHDDSPTFGAGPSCYRYLSKSVIGFEGGSTSDSIKLNINFNNDGEIQNYYPPGINAANLSPTVAKWVPEESLPNIFFIVDSTGSFSSAQIVALETNAKQLRDLLRKNYYRGSQNATTLHYQFVFQPTEEYLDLIAKTLGGSRRIIVLFVTPEVHPGYHGNAGESILEPTATYLENHATFISLISQLDFFRAIIYQSLNEANISDSYLKNQLKDAIEGTNGYPDALGDYGVIAQLDHDVLAATPFDYFIDIVGAGL